jgi:glycosyltransferase involved in cell wall biosynthesis
MEQSKKILIFSTAYYPFVGGAEVAVKEITDRISGVQFDLITARFDSKLPKFEKIGNVNFYRVGFGFKTLDKILLPFFGAIQTIKLNKLNRYDFYWCMMVTFASGGAYIANIFSKNKVPIILTLQEGDSEEHLKKRWFGLLNLSWKLALKNTKILTVISNYLGDRAKKLGYKGQIHLIPNGVNVEKFEVRNTSYEEREKIREELGAGEEDILLVTASRLVKKNGVGDVIDSLKFLPDDVKFVILGSGSLEKELKQKALSSNLEARTYFLGFITQDNLPKYLKSCDIFIRPSLSEGFGNSFIEAMACKIPVIATPVGGIPDFLIDPAKPLQSGREAQTGYFCEPENPESVAETIKRVLTDPNRNQVVENAFNMVKQKYNWNLIAEQMKEIFNKI